MAGKNSSRFRGVHRLIAVFAIATSDLIGRTLIRSAQAAFVIGYGVFFATTVIEAIG